MKVTSFEAIVRGLNEAGVQYVVAGGLAVNAHGYARFTNDVDLVVRLTPADIQAAFSALKKLGYQPSVPVTPDQFSSPTERRKLIKEKNMKVLQMWSDQHRETPVDIFVKEPFAFDREYAAAVVESLAPGVPVRFVSLTTLIAMKRKAARATDKIDVENLSAIQKLTPRKK